MCCIRTGTSYLGLKNISSHMDPQHKVLKPFKGFFQNYLTYSSHHPFSIGVPPAPNALIECVYMESRQNRTFKCKVKKGQEENASKLGC